MGLHVSCRRLIKFTEVADLEEIRRMVADEERLLVIGAGSNLLFTGNFDGTVLSPEIDYLAFTDDGVTAGAGVVMDELIAECCRRGLWGLENLSGIPGKVGASVVQNVGAYGVEVKDAVEHVYVYDLATGRHDRLEARECSFGYRDSVFKHLTGKIVTAVTYRLSREARPRLDYGNLRQKLEGVSDLPPGDVREAVIAIRDTKLPDPKKTGSAGSFFKNPVITARQFEALQQKIGISDIPHYINPDGRIKVPAAWLIERAGWKGHSEGNAGVWHLQPLVIVNLTGYATPQEILSLEERIVSSVKELSGITLVPEAEHI
ncbi:MAG: UDP-N-acetylmuramate dehydrogenase [Lachnoclostridium sp.]|nr:UDP-N-acetylmuramate dehydrogenase [Lachnoclostridium sp.]